MNSSEFLNQQAKAAGGLEKTMSVTGPLRERIAGARKKVSLCALEEINAKIAALREALNVQDVVVKSYYESD